MFDVDAALMTVIETEASDLHLKVPAPPIVRQHGKLVPIEGMEPLRPEDTEATLFHMLTDEAKLEAFRNEREVDFSYSVPGVARFRVNAFVQRGAVSLVCRAIPFEIKTAEELMLPPVIDEIADEERGLILLTGTTGSGKSTTLAAMIDHINTSYAKHIVTIEDPVEFLHRDKNSIINQREVGEDTASFARALRRVLRQDPDVHPGRRDARRGDGPHRAVRGRDRPPRALDDPHRGRRRVGQPHHRLLPAGRAAPGARDARGNAEGRDLPAARAARPTATAAWRPARSCG